MDSIGPQVLQCTWEDCESKAFTRKSDLKKHLEKHTKPYHCTEPICIHLSFGDKAGLRRHETEKHGKHGAVKYFCQQETCPRHLRGFARRNHRDLHVKACHGEKGEVTAAEQVKEDDSLSPESAPASVGEGSSFGLVGVKGNMEGLVLKLREREAEKQALVLRLEQVGEDIETLQKALQLVAS